MLTLVGMASLILGAPAAGEDVATPQDIAETAAPVAHIAVAPADGVEAPAPSTDERVFRRQPDGLFYVEALANGQRIRFVVDTGASVIVLNREDAARLGVRYETLQSSASMRTVGGASAMRWAKIERLEMAGRRMEKLHAAVVEANLPVSLMGQNALEQLGTVTLRGDTLTIE